MLKNTVAEPVNAVNSALFGNVFGLSVPKTVIERLDVPDVLKNLLACTFRKPGLYRIGPHVHVVGDPDIDAEASVSWDEDEFATCALTVWPGRIEFRRRARNRAEDEVSQVETLAFSSLSPDGRELADFARAADL